MSACLQAEEVSTLTSSTHMHIHRNIYKLLHTGSTDPVVRAELTSFVLWQAGQTSVAATVFQPLIPFLLPPSVGVSCCIIHPSSGLQAIRHSPRSLPGVRYLGRPGLGKGCGAGTSDPDQTSLLLKSGVSFSL